MNYHRRPSARGHQPVVQVGEPAGLQSVEPALAVGAHADQAGLAQQLQMLRHARLADCQRLDQIAGRPLSAPENVQNAPTVRLSQGFERAHGSIYTL